MFDTNIHEINPNIWCPFLFRFIASAQILIQIRRKPISDPVNLLEQLEYAERRKFLAANK